MRSGRRRSRVRSILENRGAKASSASWLFRIYTSAEKSTRADKNEVARSSPQRHRVRDFHCRGTEDTEEDCAEKRRRIQEPGASRRRRPRNMASNTPTVLKGQKN